MKITSKTHVSTTAAALIVGMGKRLPNGNQVLTFGGGAFSLTVDEAKKRLQQLVDNRAAVTSAQAAATAKVDAENAALPSLSVFVHELVACLRQQFGADPQALADLGIAPHKTAPPQTAEQKAVAAAKRQATREARGIVPKKQKKALKGNVTATLVVTPANATAAANAPANANAPAPAPANAPANAPAPKA